MKNTRKLPFAEITELKVPWIGEVKDIVRNYIEKLSKQKEDEAEYEGSPELLDEKYLYERFKENRISEMWNGNWEIFKYFILNFEIKIFKTMIGEWTFTDADKEMYEYFNNVHVNDKTKCKASQIKMKSGSKVNYNELIYRSDKYIIYYEFEQKNEYDSNVIQDPYFTKFIKSFDCIENMKRNCKMTAKYADEDFFTSETLYVSRIYDGCVKNGQYNKLVNVSCEKIQPCYEKVRTQAERYDMFNASQLTEVMQKFQDYCMENPKYKKIVDEMKAITIFMKEEFKKTSKDFDKLSDINKRQFEDCFV